MAYYCTDLICKIKWLDYTHYGIHLALQCFALLLFAGNTPAMYEYVIQRHFKKPKLSLQVLFLLWLNVRHLTTLVQAEMTQQLLKKIAA